MRKSWVQDPKTGKLVPKDEYVRDQDPTLYIIGDVDSFKSPIDGTVITDRAQLRRHMREHGVTDARDYSPDYYRTKARERKASLNGTTPAARRERIEAIKYAMEKHR